MTAQRIAGPPMDPNTDAADARQLALAKRQGDAYGAAVEHMVTRAAQTGGGQRAGEYIIGFAVEKAEGMYTFDDGELTWREPDDENLHIEIFVGDAADGRFVPGAAVTVTVLDRDGNKIGTLEHRLLWHPVLYYYGRNWTLPGEGTYTLRVHVAPPRFMRHDETNGRRFIEEATAEFADVQVITGQN